MNVRDVFDAYPKSIEEILGQKNVGYYIPVYQREYAWPEEMVGTLISDCLLGLNQLIDKSDSITFIGSVIVIKDNSHATIHPMTIQDLPEGLYILIDGQQRFTTITIIAVALHAFLTKKHSEYSKSSVTEDIWLSNQIERLCSDLEETFMIDMSFPKANPELRFFPKIIRALHDWWSRSPAVYKYDSPIGDFLHQYIKHSKSIIPSKKDFKYDQPDNDSFKVMSTIFGYINKQLKSISRADDDDFVFPEIDSLINSKSIKDVLFNAVIPDEAKVRLVDSSSSKDYIETFRILTFTSFVLKRIAITQVIVKNEDYAFDMFEALNTTGEPLTAFETFKPEVIKQETLKDWEASPSYDYVNRIEKLLNQHETADKKQIATSKLLIPFRLSESGSKLTKKLNEQRKFLTKTYQSYRGIDEKRLFVKSLSQAADFCSYVWPLSGQTPRWDENSDITDNTLLLCLGLLRKSGHDITMGVLMRYYSNYLNADSNSKNDCRQLFTDAVKATTAFYVLWRSSRSSTDNIDNHYRTLMASGFKDVGIDIKPLARIKNSGEVLDLEDLKKAYIYILGNKSNIKITDRTSWVNYVSQAPIYSIGRDLSKFLLLASHNDAEFIAGSLIKGRSGINPVFTLDYFNNSALTVEHIAPQNPDRTSQAWDWSIYDNNTNLPNCLGNLTLLPAVENSSIGNSSWNHKQVFYKAIACTTQQEQDKILSDAKASGVDFSNSTLKILKSSNHLSFMKSISEFNEFDEKTVSNRSQNLAELAWVSMIGWLY
jgi:uncharacterized protein with ParB-like and HNH nuclease domain